MTRTRLTLILTLMLALTAGAFAQETETVAATSTEAKAAEVTPAASETADAVKPAGKTTEEEASNSTTSYQLRSQFSQIIRDHPPELATILALDPTLLSNGAYMAAYPAIAEFVRAHPEVQRNPRFYLGDFQERPRQEHFLNDFFEGVTIFSTIGLIAFTLAWLIRTIIEQKRWSRLSRIQTEVHNKILDRFSTSEELLTYVRSPAGTKFLESAPIPVRTAQGPAPVLNSPMSRILWSIQIGAGVAVGAAGLLLLSLRFDAETAEGVFAMGAIAFCVGAGFIASAIVSLVMSRRLGLLTGVDGVRPEKLDDAGIMR
ncbi:MAG: hypothetical protein WA208_16305 [Thermoanaerobaculia bacterium]